MNNFFVPSFLISVMLHAGFLVMPENMSKNIDNKKRDFSEKRIEVELLRLVPDIVVQEKSVSENTKVLNSGKQKPADIVQEKKEESFKEKRIKTKVLKKVKALEKVDKKRSSPEQIGKINIPVLKNKLILKQIDALLVKDPPEYPELARLKGWEGEVIVFAVTDNKGYVKNAQIYRSSGYNVLDAEALKAVKKWKFSGIKAAIQVKIPIQFMLFDE